jgi:hypothetical protein
VFGQALDHDHASRIQPLRGDCLTPLLPVQVIACPNPSGQEAATGIILTVTPGSGGSDGPRASEQYIETKP